MEEILVSAATGALGPVLGKLATLAGDEYKRLKGIRGEIESLSRELTAIDVFLEKMSEEEPEDPQDKAWMKEVRELSYDAEDSLDDFMARVAARPRPSPGGCMGKVMGFVGRTKDRHRIAKAIEDLKIQAVEVSQRNARYNRPGPPAAAAAAVAAAPTEPRQVDPRALAIFEDASKLVGVEEPKEEVIQLLADEGESTQQQQPLKVVAIVGSGGLGKTTLANRVYQELKRGFDCHAFLSVSQNPDMVSVMSNILSQLDKKYSATAKEHLPQLITKVGEFLADKRYFIVVDDIWKVETWDVIKYAFPTTSYGSKIITTTRINVVAQSCRSSFIGHIYNMRPLDMTYSRQLFYGRLFNSEEKCPSYLKEISSQILEKCAGLPLAIIAIAGLLADKASKKDKWEQVMDSVGRALRNASVDVMVNVISLSYLDLPRHLKTCLLYLSIFPEDHTINKENLIRRWIGEGFIHKQAGYTAHESGEMCFNELINRSLIQPVEIDETFGHEVKSCRVHDTVHDFIVFKAIEENFVTIVGVPGVNPDPRIKVRRLSLQNGGEVPVGLVISSARSLHVFGRNAKIPSVSECRLLRVLDYEDCSQLSDDNLAGIGNLLHLKYLRFRCASALTKLPERVARIPHLEIDIDGYDRKMKIPAAIWQLQRLSVGDGYAAVPDEVAAMQGLQVLEELNVYNQSSVLLKGLGKLKSLRNLSIILNNYYAGDRWEEKQKEMVSSIAELSKASLETLHIQINEAADEIFEKDYWFPETNPPYGLRELVIDTGALSKVPTWMASLVSLEKLRFSVYGLSKEDVEILGGLPGLRHLRIQWVGDDDDEEGLEMEAAMVIAMEAHPNHPTLVWTFDE
ncbi:putative disease resistance RPP13-like protein 3 [Brachypodium distachyon]|uniref:AAA+ ATPase domain-containing protein n=1 Tax=Brachypodium distachyon TaxID=15368 RepID=I1IGR3_BRADI|nr:putative disease resistance RPP13-like protein 3 [Brachypodium distachyon]KQJ85952.1 hypothetical protein BRADI_4g02552v3 [Brachypodium distachyon]|eukprot:XP_003579187.1 putative disease resistance RPP13-like protein 3 [Brachypodium distachyon]